MLDQLFRNMTPVVKNLVIINVLFFLATFLLQSRISLIQEFGIYYFGSDYFKPYQIVTSMFMHGGIGHIFFNMFALVSFGVHLEKFWGSKVFLQFYLFSGVGSVFFSFLVDAFFTYNISGSILPDISTLQVTHEEGMKLARIYFAPSVGASGAIFGIMAAYYKFFPDLAVNILFIPIPIRIKHLMPVILLISLFLIIFPQPGDFIDHLGHLGGAVAGFIYITFFQRHLHNFDK